MADQEKYYAVATFSNLWKDGESPIEGTFIKGTRSLLKYLCEGTDSIAAIHGESHSMAQGLEIRIKRCTHEDHDNAERGMKDAIESGKLLKFKERQSNEKNN
jgi:hypothetical protein